MSRRGALQLTGAVVLAIILQTSVLPVYIADYFKPDLLLIIMVYLALRESYQAGTPLAWLLGLLKDVFSGLYLGLNAFTFLIIFLVIKSVADRLYAESGFLFVVTVTVATLACLTANLLLLFMFTNTPGIAYSIGAGMIPHVMVNCFAASLVILLPVFAREEETV
ncbi:rod shape-determining protein MreD [Geobacter sp. SVR]|uniref:rod shape-determining protein MreD n=1 Tax=Geobacter sp. SVR TaxID=2495594 RepID=UPI00143EFDED|nr:rod shape-determining protein MreD [Geobacter sp. SVR]BCS54483.1 rod shape-determining protein MreD [Geobacter sp. SVR]GCF87082.1 rod shape-determining protein MreD [Geobacter sp. SVR]